jgi:hypothetical protein
MCFFQQEYITGSTRRKRERERERERQTLIAARFDGPVGLHTHRERERESMRWEKEIMQLLKELE